MAWNIEADLKNVGQNLRKIRTDRNLTIDTVAKAIQLPPPLLQRLEDGQYPDCKLDTIFALIDYYNVPGDEVFGKSGK